MRPVTSQTPVSDNRSVGAGSYRSFMFWGVLIGLLVHGLLTGLILYYGTGQNLDVIDPGQNSKISENFQNPDYYRGGYYPGVLGQLRLARTGSPLVPGRDIE